MCGIVAYMGNRDVFNIIVEGLKILQNRGYDSAGLCCKIKDKIKMTKYASTNYDTAISLVENHKDEYIFTENILKVGVGHTRWATHGPKTTENSHPHKYEDIYVVHNGIIENYLEIKSSLLSDVSFSSQTDTEVIPCLISKEQGDTFNMFYQAISKLRGTWAIIMIREEDDSIYIAKNGSPLMIGYDENNVFISSEYVAYQKYTKHWMSLKDHECIRVFKCSGKFYIENRDGIILLSQYVPKDIFVCEDQIILDTPDPFLYWTEKEIYEQPLTIWNTLNNGGRIIDSSCVKLGGLDACEDILLKIEHLVLIGCGTSHHAALFASKLFRQLGQFDTVQVFDASEIQDNDLPKRGKVGLVVISQSGETKDCHRALQELKNNIIISIGIVNVPGSLLSRETDCGIHLNAGREVGVASTKIFTSQIVALFLMGVWFAQKKDKKFSLRRNIISHLQSLPNLFERHRDYIRNFARSILHLLERTKKMFILGRSYDYPIALEGSLKIKELTYKNIEGYPGGGLKHGPFAMIDNETIVFLHISNNIYKDRMLNAIQEIKIRGAHIVVITNAHLDTEEDINMIELEIDDEIFFSLLSVMIYQYIALELAVSLGNNPDMPRNLAKVITVDG